MSAAEITKSFTKVILGKHPQYFVEVTNAPTVEIVDLEGIQGSPKTVFEQDLMGVHRLIPAFKPKTFFRTPTKVYHDLLFVDMKNLLAYYIHNHKVLPQELFRIIYTERFLCFHNEMDSDLLFAAGVMAKLFQEYTTTGGIEDITHVWTWSGPKGEFNQVGMSKDIVYDENWVVMYNDNKEYFSVLEVDFMGIEKGSLVETINGHVSEME